jgi:hypothetical protein
MWRHKFIVTYYHTTNFYFSLSFYLFISLFMCLFIYSFIYLQVVQRRCRYLTQQTHGTKEPNSVYTVSQPRFEPATSRTAVRKLTARGKWLSHSFMHSLHAHIYIGICRILSHRHTRIVQKMTAANSCSPMRKINSARVGGRPYFWSLAVSWWLLNKQNWGL